nr:reverse transcriptase domain-containing protein [Tanacetum cinerariifolium]
MADLKPKPNPSRHTMKTHTKTPFKLLITFTSLAVTSFAVEDDVSCRNILSPEYVKDHVEIHNIKQRNGETIEDFMECFKIETRRMKGLPNACGYPDSCTRTPKEILATEASKFQPPPPMVTPVEKRSSNKFYDFHNDKGHSTDECMQLKKQIEELVRERVREIAFSQLTASNGTKGPLVIEAKMGGHVIHRMYIDGVPFTVHGMLKFLVEGGIATIPSTILIPTECASVTTSFVTPRKERTRPANFTVALHPDFPDQEVVIGGSLSDKGCTELCSILKKNLDIFAWQPSDMTGKPRSVAEHRLNIREGYTPVRQKKRGQAPERARAIQAEVQKLVDTGIMREVYYHDWLSNPVMDCNPLSKIDWKVESLYGYPFKCFLDAYKGYHQIQLAEVDEEKTAFHTGQGVYCYTKMSFGLKNAGATYQRLMDKAFEIQVGQNIEVYVDDLVVKSHTEAEIVRDIEETFRTLRKVNMKLNPKKCSFGLAEGVFLGKISAAVLDLKKCIKKSDFRWTAEAELAFQQLKQHLSELPLLVAPKPQEELIMYLSATYGAVSAVLMTERRTTQTPIYFISRALQGLELNYSPMEKLVLSLFFAAKRLRRYFQAHPITVITDQPIKQVMTRLDVAGRLQKWSIMQGEHNITYRPRTSVKGQILTDFLIEMPGDVSQAASTAVTQEEPWMLFTDGSSCVDGSGAGLILTNPEGVEFTYALRFQFAASNNEAEYEALVAGLLIVTQMRVKNIQVNVESKLVANQVLGTYVEKEDSMIKYLEIVKGLVNGFTTFSISQVSRSKNKQADALSKIASTSFARLSKQVLVEVLKNKSIKKKEVAVVIEEDGPTWMTQLVDYLKKGVLLGDNKEARKLRLKACQYELMEGVLYRRSFLTPWLRCVGPLQADYVMREIHKGSCSMHAGPRSVVAKAIRLGYYWLIMHKDARDMIRKCYNCQIHRPVTRHPQQSLTPITAPWRFYKWGINIAGPFSEGPGKVKFLIVAMDYFTKWIEAKAVATITGGSLGEGIKARLGKGNKNWVEELPHVLWAHRTMIKSSHGDTPFSLTYRTEAVIPAEIGMPTYRTAAVDVLRLNLDLLEERRERAAVCEARAKSKMMKYYNARVRGVSFKPGAFVYRSNDASHAEPCIFVHGPPHKRVATLAAAGSVSLMLCLRRWEYLLEFTSEYGIPETLHPELPGPEDRIVDFPEGKVGVYTRFCMSDPDPLSFADPPSRHPADIAHPVGGNRVTAAPEVRTRGKAAEEVRFSSGSPGQRIQARELEIKNLEALLETEADMKKAAKDRNDRVEQWCAELDARLDALSIDFDEELYSHMLTAIAGRGWVIGHGLRLVVMKYGESLEMRQAFADVVSAGIAKGSFPFVGGRGHAD